MFKSDHSNLLEETLLSLNSLFELNVQLMIRGPRLGIWGVYIMRGYVLES